MIIRKNMTPDDVQKQVSNISRFKRGFNQIPNDMNENFNQVTAKNNSSNKPNMDLNKKMQALKNATRLK